MSDTLKTIRKTVVNNVARKAGLSNEQKRLLRQAAQAVLAAKLRALKETK